MKADRPSCRFWFTALNGTILNANPSDIAGPIDIIGIRIHNIRSWERSSNGRVEQSINRL